MVSYGILLWHAMVWYCIVYCNATNSLSTRRSFNLRSTRYNYIRLSTWHQPRDLQLLLRGVPAGNNLMLQYYCYGTCMVGCGVVWCGMVWCGMVWYCILLVWYGMVWYGMVWHGMAWHGMVWYGMVWYGMVW